MSKYHVTRCYVVTIPRRGTNDWHRMVAAIERSYVVKEDVDVVLASDGAIVTWLTHAADSTILRDYDLEEYVRPCENEVTDVLPPVPSLRTDVVPDDYDG